MIYISHRGNIDGPDTGKENSPDYIIKALSLGFDVEIDVWFKDDKFYLGHDTPCYPVNDNFLKDPRLWCHAKNLLSLDKMILMDSINYFWHQNDDYTVTKNGYIWAYPGKALSNNCISVMPELINKNFKNLDKDISGYCSDYISEIRSINEQ